jgi:hypothetical protein
LIGLSHLELDLAKVERSLAAARSGLRVHDETGSRLGVLNALEAVAAAETAAQRLQPCVRVYGAAAALRERLGTPCLQSPSATRSAASSRGQRSANSGSRASGDAVVRCPGRRRPPSPLAPPRPSPAARAAYRRRVEELKAPLTRPKPAATTSGRHELGVLACRTRNHRPSAATVS